MLHSYTSIWSQVLNPPGRFEVQIFFRLLKALCADAFLSLVSSSVLSILDPRYLKPLTCFGDYHSWQWQYPGCLHCMPYIQPSWHSAVSLSSTCGFHYTKHSWAAHKSQKRSAILSAKSRFDIFSILILLDLLLFIESQGLRGCWCLSHGIIRNKNRAEVSPCNTPAGSSNSSVVLLGVTTLALGPVLITSICPQQIWWDAISPQHFYHFFPVHGVKCLHGISEGYDCRQVVFLHCSMDH